MAGSLPQYLNAASCIITRPGNPLAGCVKRDCRLPKLVLKVRKFVKAAQFGTAEARKNFNPGASMIDIFTDSGFFQHPFMRLAWKGFAVGLGGKLR